MQREIRQSTEDILVEKWLADISRILEQWNGDFYQPALELIDTIEGSFIEDARLKEPLTALKKCVTRSRLIYLRAKYEDIPELCIIEFVEKEVEKAAKAGFDFPDLRDRVKKWKENPLRIKFRDQLYNLEEKIRECSESLLEAERLSQKVKEGGFDFSELQEKYASLKERIKQSTEEIKK